MMTPATDAAREAAIEAAARAMCDRVNGIGDYDENVLQRRPGWVPQARKGIEAYEAALTEAASQPREGEVEILRRALAWHGDPARMATTREEWQQTIDSAILWVKANPEPDRPSFSSFTQRPPEQAGVVPAEVRAEAQFLSDRLDDLEWMDDNLEATLRDYMGHVDPAHERLKSALAAPTPPDAGSGSDGAGERV